MRAKIFLTTLLLFVGLISNAQKDKGSSNPKTQGNNNATGSDTPKSSSFSDSEDDYTGNTKLVNVTTDVYFLQGDEGNMGVYLIKEGVVLTDTQNEEEMKRSLKIIDRLSKKSPVKYLVSTSKTLKDRKSATELRKDGTLLFGQNITTQKTVNKKGGYTTNFKPDISFTNQMTLNFENEKVELISLNNSGNTAVYLKNKNVLFTGPVFVNKKYPEINAEKGRSVNDISKAISKTINLTNDKTKIVPGQGGIAKQIDLINTSKMLESIYKQVFMLRNNGKSLEEVLAKKSLTSNYDSKGYGSGPITTEIFITSIYNEIAKDQGPLDTRTPEEKAMARLKEIQKEQEKNKN